MTSREDFIKITTPDELLSSLKEIEYIVRHSKAYKQWLSGLIEEDGFNFPLNYDEIDFSKDKLTKEVHHVITLWRICELVGIDQIARLKEDQYTTVFDIAKEVIRYHLNDEVLCVCLQKTDHELFHSNHLNIPVNKIHRGNFINFFNDHKDCFSDDELKYLKVIGYEKK